MHRKPEMQVMDMTADQLVCCKVWHYLHPDMMHRCAIPGTAMADHIESDMQIISVAVKFACICVTLHIAVL